MKIPSVIIRTFEIKTVGKFGFGLRFNAYIVQVTFEKMGVQM